MKKLNFRSLIGMLAFASIFFLAFGCDTEEVVPLPDDGLPPLATLTDDGPEMEIAIFVIVSYKF